MKRTLLLAAAAALFFAGSAEAQIKIGVAGPMTGQLAVYGAQMKIGRAHV